jgi:hypothetical protein
MNSCTAKMPTLSPISDRFHPRFGEIVLISRQLEYRGVELVVILQPDRSLACIPAWMTREAAVQTLRLGGGRTRARTWDPMIKSQMR